MDTMTSPADTVDAILGARRSIRDFLPDPVPLAVVQQILGVASLCPSGHNTQPWQVHVVAGPALKRFTDAIMAELGQPDCLQKHRPVFDAYPPEWIPPFIDRRRKVGKDMYSLLGIPKGDRPRMQAQAQRNYRFFGAPVGLLFTLHRIMVPGSVLDLGIFLQSIMLAAKARGLDTCAQAAFANFHRVAQAQLRIDDDQVLICGMSLGHANPAAEVNRLATEREPVSRFTTLHLD